MWLPATVHCELETAGILPMDECCETDGSNHRCESGCNVVENGGPKTECVNPVPVPPQLFVILPDLSTIPLREPDQPLDVGSFDSSAYHLPQFVVRTALPIRGPSLAS